MHYEKELKLKDLKMYFKPFASLQNRILIDYKKLRDFLLVKIKEHEENGGVKNHIRSNITIKTN